MHPVVEIDGLSVEVNGRLRILDDINLSLPAGKIIGFIGPSGAGKTTLIKSIVGSLKVRFGSVLVLGYKAGSNQLRNQVSYMTQELSVYPDLTIKENLYYFMKMDGISKNNLSKTLINLLKTVDLLPKANTLVGNLSSGQKQRVSLAISLIGSPKLLVLDEPTVGLDPLLRENLWNLFRQICKSGKSLIVSSHSMDEAAKCDYLVLVRDGKIISNSTPDNFLKETSSKTIEEGFLKLTRNQKK